jgi:hypothetical protein
VGLAVAVGSQIYWIGCLARIRRTSAELSGDRRPA